jgi:hypothetical protein
MLQLALMFRLLPKNITSWQKHLLFYQSGFLEHPKFIARTISELVISVAIEDCIDNRQSRLSNHVSPHGTWGRGKKDKNERCSAWRDNLGKLLLLLLHVCNRIQINLFSHCFLRRKGTGVVTTMRSLLECRVNAQNGFCYWDAENTQIIIWCC